MTELWIVGQTKGRYVRGNQSDVAWEFQGVFDSEEKAVAACRDGNYFVAPVTLNAEAPSESIPFPGGYYPLATAGGSGDSVE